MCERPSELLADGSCHAVVYRAGAISQHARGSRPCEVLRRVILGQRRGSGDLSLEIHPTNEGRREPLGDHADLFAHWTDLAHAELTNAWLSALADNVNLLRETWTRLQPPIEQPRFRSNRWPSRATRSKARASGSLASDPLRT